MRGKIWTKSAISASQTTAAKTFLNEGVTVNLFFEEKLYEAIPLTVFLSADESKFLPQ
jgi:hypothetical protein